MGYVDQVLESGETVRYRGKLSFAAAAPAPLGIFMLLLISLYTSTALSGLGLVFTIVDIGLVVWLAASLIAIAIRRATTEIAVTDRRVVIKVGLFERRTIEMNLTRIESVDVLQGILGRIFNYGDVILRGTGAGREQMLKIDDPLGFRRSVITGQG